MCAACEAVCGVAACITDSGPHKNPFGIKPDHRSAAGSSTPRRFGKWAKDTKVFSE